MVEKFRKAFTNSTAKTNCVGKNQSGVMELSALEELPVIFNSIEGNCQSKRKDRDLD